MMNVTEIRKYAKLMQELGLTALEITEELLSGDFSFVL